MPQFQLLFNVLWWLFSSVAWIIMGIILRPSALWDFQEPHDYLTIASPALLGGLSQEIADDTGTVWLFPSWEGVSWYYFHPNFSLFILLFALPFPLIPSLQPHSRQLQELYTCLHLKSWARWGNKAAAAAKSLQSCPTLCDPVDGSPPGSPVPGILQARTLEWVTISFSNAWKRKVKVKSLSRVRLFSTHALQPTRFLCPWDFPGKNTGVGCHFLLQCRKVKSESEVTQSCPTLLDPMHYSLPGSSVHGIFQARILEWGAIAFSGEQGWAVANHILSRFVCFQVILSWCFAVLQFFAIIIIANYQILWTEDPGRLQPTGSQKIKMWLSRCMPCLTCLIFYRFLCIVWTDCILCIHVQ